MSDLIDVEYSAGGIAKLSNSHPTRRDVLYATGGGILSATVVSKMARSSPVPAATQPGAPLRNLAPLAPQPLYLLPAGSVSPTGWLKRQLEIQANGLGGRLDETWSDVGPNSGWLGGKGESWERGPYFLDGLLPLAWQLDSAKLKAKAQRFIDWTLDHPWPNGMIGPASNDDWWPRIVMLKALTQYYELTQDPRVIPVMTRYFVYQLDALQARPLKDWGKFRWQDEVVSVVWLYNHTGDGRLIRLARLLHQQGWNWRAEFENFPFKEKVTRDRIGLNQRASGDPINSIKDPALSSHGVNNAQGIKASPVWSLVSGETADRNAVHGQLAALDKYHGLPIGIFAADEHLAGRSPSQGVELCAVVETMYSLEHVLAITGDARIGDRLETIAYNALPGAFTDDMWAHQYDQQPNQIQCSIETGPWTTNGTQANLFGLEPQFGCCTANFHQGWPKLTSSLWMASEDGGLAATVYAPCEVSTKVGGARVRLTETTDYPFRDEVVITVDPERPMTFPLKLRIPAWATSAGIKVNGVTVRAGEPGSFTTIDREWRKDDRVEIAFVNAPRAIAGYNGSVSFARGALVFALPVGERWEKIRDRGLTADWQVFPTTSWSYGVLPETLKAGGSGRVAPVPFSKGAPVTLTVSARPVEGWDTHSGAANPPPWNPIASADSRIVLTLVPYAAAKLRVTSFPTLRS